MSTKHVTGIQKRGENAQDKAPDWLNLWTPVAQIFSSNIL